MKQESDIHRTSLLLATLLIVGGLSPSGAFAAESGQVVTGRLSVITAKMVEIDRTQRFNFDAAKVQCVDFRGDRLTCETLVGIGYADKVRVTISAGLVTRIEILELQQ